MCGVFWHDCFFSFSSCLRRYVYTDNCSIIFFNLTEISFIFTTKKNPKLYHGFLISPCSTLVLRMCTWRETSSSPAVQQLVLRPLLTCVRCATAFASPLESISSFPLPLNQTRTETFMCGCSLRKMLISSKFTKKLQDQNYTYSNIYHWPWFTADFREIDDSVECHIKEVKSHTSFDSYLQ